MDPFYQQKLTGSTVAVATIIRSHILLLPLSSRQDAVSLYFLFQCHETKANLVFGFVLQKRQEGNEHQSCNGILVLS